MDALLSLFWVIVILISVGSVFAVLAVVAEIVEWACERFDHD